MRTVFWFEFCCSNRYVTLLWHAEMDAVRYCFFMSDKLEPYIIITALSDSGTR